MSHLSELVKRGLSYQEACMMVEAIYSCAIEGIKEPSTKEDYDKLVAFMEWK